MCDKKNNYWGSLSELERSPDFLTKSQNEFSEELPFGFLEKISDSVFTRRDFLKLMGFGSAAVMAACSPMPIEKAIPFLIQPENIVPGKAYWYASTCGACPANCGILVKTRDGRPIKIEGNAKSSISQGGLCASGQASVLELYDSGRLHQPLINGSLATWDSLDREVMQQLEAIQAKGGKIRILTGSISSPSTQKTISDFIKTYPNTRHVVYDAISCSGLIEAHKTMFGKKVLPHFQFDQADLIVSLSADFLGTWISPVEFSKQYSQARRVEKDHAKIAQHIQFESRLSLTGANADIRVPVKPSEMGIVALKLLHHISSEGISLGRLDVEIEKAAKKLLKHQGRSLVVCGSNDLPTQQAVAKLNFVLGNYGKTLHVEYPSLQTQGIDSDMQELVSEMNESKVDALIISGVNPVYDYPESKKFISGLEKVGLTISLNSYHDETARLVKYVAPQTHALESWGDAEPISAQYHLFQPVVAPIYHARSLGDSLLHWQGKNISYHDYLKSYWQENIFPLQSRHLLFDSFWQECVHEGVYMAAHGPSLSPQSLLSTDFAQEIISSFQNNSKTQGFEFETYESVALRDGRGANNPWLQELPDPISKITWDNYLNISVSDAKSLGIGESDVVLVKVENSNLELPAYIQPGQKNGTVSVALGYGRLHAGKVGTGVGVNVFSIPSFVTGAQLITTAKTHALAITQTHYSMEGRPIVRDATVAEYNKNHAAGNEESHDLVMLWQQHENKGNSWGMALDLNACIGCSGCLVGCQAENNVPVVGQKEVLRRREMSWLRIDRYYKGDTENPEVAFQPMMCQHCANAPCESVCPVLATVHSSDGLNQQVYNRCVGTRYCANNCPYKVRRFNWFDYAQNKKFDFYMNDNTGRLVLNPDVVVRSRGVMEKCSMCIQRIQDEKNRARRGGRDVNSDDIKTACQQSCPTDAIVFGDLNNPKSRISKLLAQNKRRYHVLGELNVKPAVNYLTKLREKS